MVNNIETTVLISALAIFLFNNLAPWYVSDFQMRGEWIARIYQPLFIVFMMYIIRFSSHIFNDSAIQKNIFVTLIAVCFLGGVVLNFGVCLKSNFTQWAWHRFYQHSPPDTMQKNLSKFGIRPIGFPDNSEQKTSS